METFQGARPRDALAQALACFDKAESARLSTRRRPPKPKFKPLVLSAAPGASVRRSATTSQFECFVDGRRVHVPGCACGHSTADRAWLCLARYVSSPAYTAARGGPQ